ncbi:MAG: DUF934 domain-containing protein [Pseudomonadota bacterium]
MAVIVTDAGFEDDGFNAPWVAFDPDAEDPAARPEAVVAAGAGLDLPNTVAAEDLRPYLGATAIRVTFPSFADGRGFTIARSLRLMGYEGRLRAQGHVLADQYAQARRCGFDEVEIDADLAARQPEDQWRARANWRAHDYQARLRASV